MNKLTAQNTTKSIYFIVYLNFLSYSHDVNNFGRALQPALHTFKAYYRGLYNPKIEAFIPYLINIQNIKHFEPYINPAN